MDGKIFKESRKLLNFLTPVIASSGGIKLKLGWLWIGNFKPINFCKMPKLIQSIKMGQIFFKVFMYPQNPHYNDFGGNSLVNVDPL